MTKAELIEVLSPPLIRKGHSAKDVRSVLETYAVPALEEMVRKGHSVTVENDPDIIRQVEAIRAEAREQVECKNAEANAAQQAESEAFYRSYYLDQLFAVVYKGKRAVRNVASEKLIESWLNPGESLNAGWFIKVLTEQPSLAKQLQWESASFDQTAADRDTFTKGAKLYRYSVNDANFGLLQSVLGSGFSQYDIENAISTNAVSLAPATKLELDHWKAEDIEEHNQKLLQASPTELRALARQESEQKRAQEQQQRANDAFETSKQRDQATDFPPLPPELTKQEIRNASPERIKYWLKRFGTHQINLRLNSRG